MAVVHKPFSGTTMQIQKVFRPPTTFTLIILGGDSGMNLLLLL
jgi:hypothetical protein